jgi:hypothetical protein
MARLRLISRDWSVHQVAAEVTTSRRGATKSPIATTSLPTAFLTAESSIADEFVAEPSRRTRRAASIGPLDFHYTLANGETAILAIRHPSGALAFHLPIDSSRRGKSATADYHFVVTVSSVDIESGRRGIVSGVITVIIIKVAKLAGDKFVSLLLPKLAAAYEANTWKKGGLSEGWHKVTLDSLSKQNLHPAEVHPGGRSLLFLHGTFSDAASAFCGLASASLFEQIASIYGDRVFAFNHFTVSRTPEENARTLLAGLPDTITDFDVITHSRGGLVLRTLVERSDTLGPEARRFRLGRAVLVASPNSGTPLATPSRWKETIGWIANLLEIFPDNPFTTATEFVANALVWMARHASGDLPGLHSMDARGDIIGELQAPPGPPPGAYSALVSNYAPDAGLLKRMVDAGIDEFFGGANDLVVPTEGGWQVDESGVVYIPGDRIGCYGPGGNLGPSNVTHVDFFSKPETAEFLIRALNGQTQRLSALDAAKPLPDRRLLRAAGHQSLPSVTEATTTPRITPVASTVARQIDGTAVRISDSFQLFVLPRSDSDARYSQLLAQYGSARVLEDFFLGGHETAAGSRWKTIIGYQESIKKYVNESQGQMPSPAQLEDFGRVLFDTLFPGAVRRLYDTARSLQRSERLNVILTSTIPWIADKPWEFAYDPVRRTSLATEDIHFIRNVLTAVPAEIINDRQRLRILVASSQPLGAGRLSIQEEEAVIRRGFEALRESGLVDVEVLARATPASLHGYVSTGEYTAVHFIGHGEFDAKDGKGYLIFQDDQGNPYKVDDRSMREILCGRQIRLVFLNACDSGRGGSADFNSGVAPALMAGGVPIVVANQYKVLDTSATFFAQHFYWSLAQGLSVGESAREARVAVNYSLSGESIDWAIPVVYARDPNSRLCPPRSFDPRSMPSPLLRPSARRSVARHEVRVAIWDTHSQFPTLRSLVEQLNGAQSYFGFEVVDLSVPIDAWYFHDGKRYLDADRFAQRLAPQIAQLGVTYIAAIVDEWMVCDLGTPKATMNIYGWWPDQDSPPILIFSTMDLGLEPKGPASDRAIVNLVVAGLSGYLLSKDAHKRGPRTCPNFYNEKRDRTVITGKQHLCAQCEKLLAKDHPEELKALKGILKVFN